jgi:hypothetical protein
MSTIWSVHDVPITRYHALVRPLQPVGTMQQGGYVCQVIGGISCPVRGKSEGAHFAPIQLSRAHQRPCTTIEQFYAYLAERCVGLAQPRTEVDLVTTFTYGLIAQGPCIAQRTSNAACNACNPAALVVHAPVHANW